MAVTKPTTGTATKKSTIDAVIDMLDDHESRLGTVEVTGVSNPSFEIASSVATVPSGWTWTPYTDGTSALVTTNVHSGAQAVQITQLVGAGKGGGYLVSTEFIPVELSEDWYLTFAIKSTTAIRNMVEILWYTKAQVAIAAVTARDVAYDVTGSVSDLTKQFFHTQAPASACFAKLKITGGMDTVNLAGVATFDSIKFEPVPPAPAGKRKFFAASGTFSVPIGVTTVFVTQSGGGAGGGAAIWDNLSPYQSRSGGGGGAGAMLIKFPVTVTPLASVTVTVGAGGTGGATANFRLTNGTLSTAGGTTSFGSVNALGGGLGGRAEDSSSGVGGSGAVGRMSALYGGSGTAGVSNPAGSVAGGAGGTGWCGDGGAGASAASGGAGTGYGAGGAGAGTANTGTLSVGGAGSAGFVLVEW